MTKTNPAQFEALVSFMERHGDLNKPGQFSYTETFQKWNELVFLLNSKSCGANKSVCKWKKCWSDLKNNTQRKVRKIAQSDTKVLLTKLEKRILAIMRKTNQEQRNVNESIQEIMVVVKEENESNSYQTSPSPEFFAEVESKDANQRLFLESSMASSTSSRTALHPKIKSEIPENFERPADENSKDMADMYIEFEREREKMAHEREMARIKQNDQFYNLFGRMVNVLENLAPSIQRYFDSAAGDK